MPIDYTEYNAHVTQGDELFKFGDYSHALRAYWNAFRIDPASPVLLFNMGRSIEELNQPPTMGAPLAEDFYAAAVSLGNVDGLYELALCFEAEGNKSKAAAYMREFLKTYKQDDEYAKIARERAHNGLALVGDNA